MDYLKNAEKIKVDGAELSFIRCDKDGNLLSLEALAGMNFSNPTIDRIVTQTAGKLRAIPEPDGSFTDGFTS